MKKFRWVLCLLAFFVVVNVTAQSKHTRQVVKKESTQVQNNASKKSVLSKIESIDNLIKNYRFAEAQRTINTLKGGTLAASEQHDLEIAQRQATLGANMMSGIEQLLIFDSIKVAKDDAVALLRFSKESGSVVSNASQQAAMIETPTAIGDWGYINDFGDKYYLSATTDSIPDRLSIVCSYAQNNQWSKPVLLSGLQDSYICQTNPFMMPDGATIYFASECDESIGGFDLFRSRYDSDTKEFLKAENLGFPYNSPYNDYLLAIDESSQLGWLVSDRYQSPDTVCIYLFIPQEYKTYCNHDELTQSELIAFASLAGIGDLQSVNDADAIAQAKQRYAALENAKHSADSYRSYFVIDDQTVYTDINQFKSETARRIAQQIVQVEQQVKTLQSQYDQLIQERVSGQRTSSGDAQLRAVNTQMEELQRILQTLYKNMRKAELKH